MKKRVRSVALVACVAAFPFTGVATVEAKQQCHAARNSNGGWWSYRIIDERKCWYEGKPGLAKSSLEWRAQTTPRPRPREDRAAATPPAPAENPGNPLDAQAWAPVASDTFEEL